MNSTPLKVLLIDDDRLQFRLTHELFRTFQNERYELEWVSTYAAGLSRLVTGHYAVCLLDYQLRDGDGLHLMREAVSMGCRTPIVFLTAEATDRIDRAAMEAGALDYLVKCEITPRLLERSIRYASKLGATLEALRQMATRDSLTGLLNRREFDRILQEEEERAARFGDPVALVMLDLDHFKAINDAHGHPVGDQVLRETARRFSASVRTVDRVARLGGEEFALVLIETDRRAAEEVAERVVAAIRSAPVVTADGLAVTVTVSAGVAALPEDAPNAAELVIVTDKALYAAKAAGRNRVIVAGRKES